MTDPYQSQNGTDGMSPEQERAEHEHMRAQQIAWCEARDIDPFDIVADGGVEAWMAVTKHNLKEPAR
jgi:hypothetical protein